MGASDVQPPPVHLSDKDLLLIKRLNDVGNELLQNPPLSKEELLGNLDRLQLLLSSVYQVPAGSFHEAVKPSMEALVADGLLHHADEEVKISITCCISEILRIKAPVQPYDDNITEEFFKLAMMAFGKLAKTEDRCYPKAESILQMFAKFRLCVIMLDLELDALTLEMFRLFLNSIRPENSNALSSYMETIMTIVIQDSEEISPDLLNVVLASVKKENRNTSPLSYVLGAKVLRNCDAKLRKYLPKAVKSLGIAIDDYAEIVGLICREATRKRNSDKKKLQPKSSRPKGVGPSRKGPPKVLPGDKPKEATLSSDLAKKISGGDVSGNASLNSDQVNPNGPNDNKELPPNSSCHKDVSPSENGPPKVQAVDKGKELLPSDVCPKEAIPSSDLAKTMSGQDVRNDSSDENLTITVKSLNPESSEIPTRRGRKPNSLMKPEEGYEHTWINAEEKSGKTSRKGKEVQKGTGRPPKHPGSKGPHSSSVPGEAENSKPTASQSLNSINDLNPREEEENILNDGAQLMPLSDSLITSSSESSNAESMTEPPCKEGENVIARRLVGCRVKVWWPLDRRFYEGTITYFSHFKKKHKVKYDDGDKETLDLSNECWELLDDPEFALEGLEQCDATDSYETKLNHIINSYRISRRESKARVAASSSGAKRRVQKQKFARSKLTSQKVWPGKAINVAGNAGTSTLPEQNGTAKGEEQPFSRNNLKVTIKIPKNIEGRKTTKLVPKKASADLPVVQNSEAVKVNESQEKTSVETNPEASKKVNVNESQENNLEGSKNNKKRTRTTEFNVSTQVSAEDGAAVNVNGSQEEASGENDLEVPEKRMRTSAASVLPEVPVQDGGAMVNANDSQEKVSAENVSAQDGTMVNVNGGEENASAEDNLKVSEESKKTAASVPKDVPCEVSAQDGAVNGGEENARAEDNLKVSEKSKKRVRTTENNLKVSEKSKKRIRTTAASVPKKAIPKDSAQDGAMVNVNVSAEDNLKVSEKSKKKRVRTTTAASSVINVNGYEVKASSAPILEEIFAKHGDIASECPYAAPRFRASIFEIICDIVRQLRTNNWGTILSTVGQMKTEISDTEAASKIDVSWLKQILEDIPAEENTHIADLDLFKNTSLACKAARKDLKQRTTEVLIAQHSLEEAKRRLEWAEEGKKAAERAVEVLESVEEKARSDVELNINKLKAVKNRFFTLQ